MPAYRHTYIHTDVRTYMYLRTCVYNIIYVHTAIQLHLNTCIHVCLFVGLSVYSYVHVHIDREKDGERCIDVGMQIQILTNKVHCG